MLRPSAVGFKSKEVLFGSHVLSEMKHSPSNIVTNVKGLSGRKLAHIHVQLLRKRKAYGLYDEEKTRNLLVILPSAVDFVGEDFNFCPE